MDTPRTKPHRKPYAKPAVEEVRLRVSEAVLGITCRATLSNAFVQAGTTICTEELPTQCQFT